MSDTTQYGAYYWCVQVKPELSNNGRIYVMADDAITHTDGSLALIRHKPDGTKHTNLLIPSGSWLAVYAASMLDGRAVAVDSWGYDEDEEEDEDFVTDRPRALKHNARINTVAGRDGWDCHYCGRALHQTGMMSDTALPWPQVEHKIPKSLGGRDEMSNYVLSCRPCNNQKSNRYTYEEFYAMTAPLRAANQRG